MLRSPIIRHLLILAVGIGAAVLLSRLGVFSLIIGWSKGFSLIAIFVAGLFYTSALTAVPAALALGELSQTQPFILLAAIGAIGGVLADLLISNVILNNEEKDIEKILTRYHLKKLIRFYHRPHVRALMTLGGFLIIASPLPDELGLALMGLSEVRLPYFVVLSYFANFTGILIVAAVFHNLV